MESYTGELCASDVMLRPDQKLDFEKVLDRLAAEGLVAVPTLFVSGPPRTLAEVMQVISERLSAPIVEAVQASLAYASTPSPPPIGVMHVWAFEEVQQGNPDVLVAMGKLWGVDVWIEAIRMEDADLGVVAAGGRAILADRGGSGPAQACNTVRLPGREADYVLFAST